MLLGEDSWLTRGSEVTDPQTPDLLRETGRQSKEPHNFLTLLARNRVNKGWHTVLNRTEKKQGRIASSVVQVVVYSQGEREREMSSSSRPGYVSEME